MEDRDLIVGVLAAQAGFATPSQVLSAAATALVDFAPDSLLTRLERTGTLSVERRRILEALVEQTLAARKGDARAVLESLVIQTLTSSIYSLGVPPEVNLVFKAALIFIVMLLQSAEFRASIRRLAVRPAD